MSNSYKWYMSVFHSPETWLPCKSFPTLHRIFRLMHQMLDVFPALCLICMYFVEEMSSGSVRMSCGELSVPVEVLLHFNFHL